MVLGMLGSMESLMSSSALENLCEIKVDSNKELVGQGLGNIAASLLGSISDDRKIYQLKEFEVFNNFSDGEVDTFKEFLDLKTFTKGNAIISEGQNDRDLLMMTRGLVSITLHLPNSDRTKRLFTVTSGAIIGEMALLDGQPRSTDVWADEDSEFYRLTFDGFKKICSDHPQIALKFVSNIALVINQRCLSEPSESFHKSWR
jgi:SulP family sulfate permease